MLNNLFYVLLALMSFLAVSPWQTILRSPFYYGFAYYLILMILFILALFRKDKVKRDHLLLLVLLAYFAVNLLSLLINYLGGGSPIKIVSNLESPGMYNLLMLGYLFCNILTIFVISRFIKDRDAIQKATRVLIFSAAIASLWGIIMVVLHLTGTLSPDVLGIQLFPRLCGTATEPQVYGNFLLSIIPVNLALLLMTDSGLSAAAFFINLLAFVMTFSMGAWVALAISLSCFTVLNICNFSRVVIFRIMIMLVFISVLLLTFNFIYPSYLSSMGRYFSKIQVWKVQTEAKEYKQRMQGLDEEILRPELVEKVDDKLARLWMAQTAGNMFIKNPVLGIGPGNYGFLYNQYKPAGTPRKVKEKPHNAYLEILAESGIVGFALFMGALLVLFGRGLAKYRSLTAKNDKILFTGLLAALIGLLVHGLSFGILAHNHTWITIGLIWAAINILE